MKIAFLLTQSLDSPSGLGRFGPFARELAHNGHEVEVFALHPDWNRLAEKKYIDQDVSVHYVSQMHVIKRGSVKSYFNSRSLLWISALATIRLASALWRSKAEAIQVCKPQPMNSLAALLASRGRKIFCDCDDYEAGSGNFSQGWQHRMVAWFEKQMPFKAQFVTTNTHFMREQLISWGVPASKITYLPNGIDRMRFHLKDPEKVGELRRDLELESKHVIAYVGSIGLASHAVDLLIDAFATILKDLPDSVLMMVGGGEDLQALQAYSQSSGLASTIRWVGKVPPDEAPLYYRLADVTVDPVRDDLASRGRAPLKLFESWACGVPFVSADVGDRRLLLGDPPAGLLARPGDPGALAQAILQILTDKDLAQLLCARGLQRIEDYYWDQLILKVNGIYA